MVPVRILPGLNMDCEYYCIIMYHWHLKFHTIIAQLSYPWVAIKALPLSLQMRYFSCWSSQCYKGIPMDCTTCPMVQWDFLLCTMDSDGKLGHPSKVAIVHIIMVHACNHGTWQNLSHYARMRMASGLRCFGGLYYIKLYAACCNGLPKTPYCSHWCNRQHDTLSVQSQLQCHSENCIVACFNFVSLMLIVTTVTKACSPDWCSNSYVAT